MQVEQPLLHAEMGTGTAEGAHEWHIEIHGIEAKLTLKPDGSFEIRKESDGGIWSLFRRTEFEGSSLDLVGATLSGNHSIQLWYMPLKDTKHKDRSVRALHKTPLLRFSSPEHASEALKTVHSLVCPLPRRILVIINPASGRGIAPSVYRHHVKPILDAAGISSAVEHITASRGHATKILKSVQPQDADTVLSMGGDGTMFEVLQGVLQRPDWDTMRRVQLVQIPCGSGNALAASTGLYDVATAVHAALRGQPASLDIASILQPSGTRIFSFLSVVYGMLANLDLGTEHLRWMGSLRFTVGAIVQLIKQRTFKLKVAYLEAEAAANDREINGNEERGGVASVGLEESKTNQVQARERLQQQSVSSTSSFDLGHGPALQHYTEFSGVISSRSAAATSHPDMLPPRWKWLAANDVQIFAACNLARLEMNSLFAPDAAPGNGHFNLLYTVGRAGRKKGLELLLESERGGHMHLVEQKLIKAMWIEPHEAEGETWLVVDGEQVPYKPLYTEVHPRLCTVLVPPATGAALPSSPV